MAAHELHGLSAIAALTAQHARGVTVVHVPPVAFLHAQSNACFDDFRRGPESFLAFIAGLTDGRRTVKSAGIKADRAYARVRL